MPALTAEWYLNFSHYPFQRRELKWTGPFLWVKHAWTITYTTYRTLHEVTILPHTMEKLRLRKTVSLTQSHTVSSGANIQRWVFHLQNLPALHFITFRSQVQSYFLIPWESWHFHWWLILYTSMGIFFRITSEPRGEKCIIIKVRADQLGVKGHISKC